MNTKIKEMALQSGAVFDWVPGSDSPKVYFENQEQLDKFAELIVEKCSQIISDLEQYEGAVNPSNVEYLKDYFGF